MAVDLQKTVSTDGKTIRYRFDSPFAYTVSGQDELGGYIGFPYNEEGDCDGQSHKMIVKVSGTTATLAPTYIGMNWADYGKFSIGQIVGNLKMLMASLQIQIHILLEFTRRVRIHQEQLPGQPTLCSSNFQNTMVAMLV